MRTTGIIGAMEEEVAALKELMEVQEVRSIAGMEFCRGIFEDQRIIVVRSGIGKVNAAVCTQILCDVFRAEAIINTGVAGSLRNAINIGDIVLSSDALQHDVDVSGCGHEPGEIPRMETSVFKADEALLDLAEKVCREVNPDIPGFQRTCCQRRSVYFRPGGKTAPDPDVRRLLRRDGGRGDCSDCLAESGAFCDHPGDFR